MDLPGLSSLLSIAEVPSDLAKAGANLPPQLTKVMTNGVGPLTSSRGYARDRLRLSDEEPDQAIRRILKDSVAASESTDFAQAVGRMSEIEGPVPTEVAGIAVINAHMVGAIAELRGWDIEDPSVQSVALLLISGSSAPVIARAMTILLGKSGTSIIIGSGALLVEVNKRLGVILLAQYGTQKVAAQIAGQIPLVGSLAASAVDSTLTKSVGEAATKVFVK